MKQRLYITTIIATLVIAVIFYILGAEIACCGLVFSLWQLYEIKHALEPDLKLFSYNPTKKKCIRQGKLKKYRVRCIIVYTVIILASISSFIGHLCS